MITWAKKNNGPWLFRVLYGHYTSQLCGDYFINHDIRIPFINNQDFMESKAGISYFQDPEDP